ncbi:hypothetical protein CYD53_10317 [Bosea psychrotolerans]|uniref:DUF2975 family protein n=2 Tax=Bosea psychrotolerans TaxID=1871628 RepID=A0A2S4MGS1_9HYPH|nr:hypothetical protein CYD53_10317 [Bosea psychrotolerans]
MMASTVPSSTGASLLRLRRISVAARFFSYAAAALMAFGMVWLWRDPESLASYARGTIGLGGSPIVPSVRGYWTALGLGTVPAGLFIAAMLSLAALFRRFGKGLVLEEENAWRLGRVGWLFIGLGLATPVARALQSVALTFDNPAGQKQLAITLDPGTFGALAAGAALVAFGLVLKEAVRLADENQSFV